MLWPRVYPPAYIPPKGVALRGTQRAEEARALYLVVLRVGGPPTQVRRTARCPMGLMSPRQVDGKTWPHTVRSPVLLGPLRHGVLAETAKTHDRRLP